MATGFAALDNQCVRPAGDGLRRLGGTRDRDPHLGAGRMKTLDDVRRRSPEGEGDDRQAFRERQVHLLVELIRAVAGVAELVVALRRPRAQATDVVLVAVRLAGAGTRREDVAPERR